MDRSFDQLAPQLNGSSTGGRPPGVDPTKWYFGPGGAIPPDSAAVLNPPPAATPITQAVKNAEPVSTQPLQDAANINIVAPTPPAPNLMQGPIQTGLGLPPTSELANKYRYNPYWRAI